MNEEIIRVDINGRRFRVVTIVTVVTFDQNVKNAISAEFEILAASLPDW